MEIKKQEIPWSIPDWGDGERKAAQKVIDGDWLTMGKETKEFEKELGEVTGYKHNVVVNSGTSAITAALLAMGAYHFGYTCRIPAYTYKATENACHASGLNNLIYGDVDKHTCLLTPKESKCKYEIQIPVHFAGLPINQQVWGKVPCVVEDAAESFGSSILDTGGVHNSRIACYSFHAAKLITMIEGGCASTNNDVLAERLRAVRVHGENPNRKGEFVGRGFNFKPLDICSSVGRVQLKKLKKYLAVREAVAMMYREELDGYVGFQEIPDYVKQHSNMMFPIYVDNPMRLADMLRSRGIDTRLGWKPLADKPNAWWIYEHILCLPIYNTMKPNETMYVVDEVKKCLT